MNAPQQKSPEGAKPAIVIPIAKQKLVRPPLPKGLRNRLKKNWIGASALVCVLLPFLVASVYLGFIASNRYSAEVKFAVRGQETPAIDALGVIGLGGGNSMSGDSYILVDYVGSRGMWEEVSKSVDLDLAFTQSGVDWLSRMGRELPIERRLEYWRKMTHVSYEPSTGIIRAEVTAFDREDVVKIANAVTSTSEALINRLSTESRRDALKAATAEVERAEQRQRVLRTAIRKFREKEKISDPARRAGFQQGLMEKTRSELQRIETELQAARAFMKDDAPSVVVLKNQKTALLSQLDRLQSEIGGDTTVDARDGSRSVASMLSSFEEIEAERLFAEKAYLTALASLERARLEADRKQRFLAIYSKADLPDEARYPERLRGVFSVLIVASLLWGLGVLLIIGIREHT